MGVETVVFDNLSTGHAEAVQGPFFEADLGDRAAIRQALTEHRPQAVMHFAGKCYVGESVTEPSDYYRANVLNTINLLDEMRAQGVKDIVFSSTCATYGQPEQVPIPDDGPEDPLTPYGRTKLMVEKILADFGRAYGLRHVALRYFNAAGAAPDGTLGEVHEPETHLIPRVLQVAQGVHPEVLVFGDNYPTPDGTCIRDYIHVWDLAQAHLDALAVLQAGGEALTCNLGTGSGFSVLEIIQVARSVTGREIPAKVVEPREGDPARLVSGGERAGRVLGWAPRRPDLHSIIEDAWRFHEGHPNGY